MSPFTRSPISAIQLIEEMICDIDMLCGAKPQLLTVPTVMYQMLRKELDQMNRYGSGSAVPVEVSINGVHIRPDIGDAVKYLTGAGFPDVDSNCPANKIVYTTPWKSIAGIPRLAGCILIQHEECTCPTLLNGHHDGSPGEEMTTMEKIIALKEMIRILERVSPREKADYAALTVYKILDDSIAFHQKQMWEGR